MMETEESPKVASAVSAKQTTATSTKEPSQVGRLPRPSGLTRPSTARRANDAWPPASQSLQLLHESVVMRTNEPDTSTCSSTASPRQRYAGSPASQWSPSNASTDCTFVQGSETDRSSRRRHVSYPEVDKWKSFEHELVRSNVERGSEREQAAGRSTLVEEDVTQLIALEDVDIPTDSGEDDELDEVRSWLRQPINDSSNDVMTRHLADRLCGSTAISKRQACAKRTETHADREVVDLVTSPSSTMAQSAVEQRPSHTKPDIADEPDRTNVDGRISRCSSACEHSDDERKPSTRTRPRKRVGCVRRWCSTVLYLLVAVTGVSLAAVNRENIARLVVGYINVDMVHEMANMNREIVHLKKALADMSSELRRIAGPVDKHNSTICSANFTSHLEVNGCYAVVTEKKEWVNADLTCKRLHKNAHLVFIDSEHEQSTIRRLLQALSDGDCSVPARPFGPFFWIGGQRLNPLYKSTVVWKTLSWSSIDDCSSEITKEMVYSKWRHGEPDYKQGSDMSPEACVSLDNGADGAWSDEQCTHKFCFVCELDIKAT